MTDSPTIHLSGPRGGLLACAVAGFAFLAATLVPVQTSTAQGQPAVDIEAATDGISVEFFVTTPRNVLIFSVSVVGPDNFAFEQRIEGASVQWIPPDNLADGLYTWEAWVVTADVGAQMRELTPDLQTHSIDHWFDDDVKQIQITSGTFRVENGLLESISNSQVKADGTSMTRRVAAAILDFLVPPTHAQDVTTSGDFRAGSGLVAGSETENPAQGEVRFVFPAGNNAAIEKFENILQFEFPAGTSRMALHSSGNFGIGTTTPSRSIHVVAGSPALQLEGTGGSFFRLRNNTAGVGFLNFDTNMGSNRMVLTGDGNLGIGDFGVPDVILHVRRNNNTAQVRVQDTGASDPGPGQTMFNLINNGPTKFRMEDTSQADVRWEFRTSGIQGDNERFQMNKLGSGVVEMQVFAGGDVSIAGFLTQASSRALKERITELEPEQVLARLDSLSVHEWSYQRSPKERHLGPMAEDFHAAFGLGRDSKHIAPGDLAGVALAAAKGLAVRSARLEAENAELRDRLDRENAELRDRLEQLEAMLQSSM